MARQGLTDSGSVAVDQIEYARGNARLIHNLCIEISRQRRDLAGLKHHSAAHRQRRRNLTADLIERPIPGRDQTAHTDGLFHHPVRAQILGEGVVLQNLRGFGDVAQSGISLRGARQFDRGTHFQSNRLSNLGNAALENLCHPLEHSDTLLHRGLAKGFKRGLGRGNRQIDVGF